MFQLEKAGCQYNKLYLCTLPNRRTIQQTFYTFAQFFFSLSAMFMTFCTREFTHYYNVAMALEEREIQRVTERGGERGRKGERERGSQIFWAVRMISRTVCTLTDNWTSACLWLALNKVWKYISDEQAVNSFPPFHPTSHLPFFLPSLPPRFSSCLLFHPSSQSPFLLSFTLVYYPRLFVYLNFICSSPPPLSLYCIVR